MLTAILLTLAIAAPPTITGRTIATTGELVVLQGDAPSDVFTWVYDRQSLFDTLQCGTSLAFATPQPGVYRFWLVVHDEGELLTVSHVVTISGPAQPILGASPEAPSDAISQLATRIAEQAKSLDDSETLALLVAAWRSAAAAIRAGPDLQSAAAALDKAQQAAFAARPLQRRRYGPDWIEGWRKPVNEWIEKAVESGVIKTPDDYSRLWQSVLEQAGKR